MANLPAESVQLRDLARLRRVRDRIDYAIMLLATKDLDVAFERIQASGAEIVEEPMMQPYGVRDCAVRDPAPATCCACRNAAEIFHPDRHEEYP